MPLGGKMPRLTDKLIKACVPKRPINPEPAIIAKLFGEIIAFNWGETSIGG